MKRDAILEIVMNAKKIKKLATEIEDWTCMAIMDSQVNACNAILALAWKEFFQCGYELTDEEWQRLGGDLNGIGGV